MDVPKERLQGAQYMWMALLCYAIQWNWELLPGASTYLRQGMLIDKDPIT